MYGSSCCGCTGRKGACCRRQLVNTYTTFKRNDPSVQAKAVAAAAVAARAAAAANAVGAAGGTPGVKAEQANGVKAEPVFPSGPVINTVEGELGKVQTKEEDDKFMYSTKVRDWGLWQAQ